MGGLQIIGQRLVRTFGEGENLRTVVTQTLEKGKTFTQVLDKDGQIIQERLKVINPMEKVGDKFVRTMTKVYEHGYKMVTDKVFNSEGQNMGARARVYRPNGTIKDKTLFAVGKGGQITFYYDGCKERKYTSVGKLYYNGKGLPLPRTDTLENELLADKTMLEMRQWLQKRFPQRTYFDGFPHYNKTIDENVLGNVTGLDKYL